MLLYMMRHGLAHERGADGSIDDFDRTLTPEGIDKVRKISLRLLVIGAKPEVIISSPFLRARQTADIICEVIKPRRGVEELEFLESGTYLNDEFSSWLAGCESDSVLAVGHLPDLPVYASSFLVGTRALSMKFAESSICCINFDSWPGPSRGRLEWHMQPDQFLL